MCKRQHTHALMKVCLQLGRVWLCVRMPELLSNYLIFAILLSHRNAWDAKPENWTIKRRGAASDQRAASVCVRVVESCLIDGVVN